jgi:6-phosphogluconolactonase (cycloisomerase 2 family)
VLPPSIRRTLLTLSVLFAGLPVSAARDDDDDDDDDGDDKRGVVYVATNEVAANAVLVFARSGRGELDPVPEVFPTGGQGTGTGLGNQGGVVLSENEKLLFVVNAGSDTISVFDVDHDGLELLSVTPSGGRRPVSLTQHEKVLYVLNAGGAVGASDSIAGFRIHKDGDLDPIGGSVQPLSAANTGPAQVGFDQHGSVLVVTEKATNIVTTYLVDKHGRAGPPCSQPSVGATPFGFAFGKHGQLFVSEAFGGAPGASTVTSYFLTDEGELEVLDPSVPTTETAACWVVVSRSGHFAYVTNTGADTVSGFAIKRDGSLRLLDSDGVTAETGGGPIDMDFSRDGRNLYTLNAGDGTVSAFRRTGEKGALDALPSVGGLPTSSNGLAAR